MLTEHCTSWRYNLQCL